MNLTGRNTQGVIFAKPDAGDRIIAVALGENGSDENADGDPDAESGGDGSGGEDSVQDGAVGAGTEAATIADGVGSSSTDTATPEPASGTRGADEHEDEMP